jgi:hypothetical protein
MGRRTVKPQPRNLASVFRGLYARVASRLNVDPSYVSRVARGERRSKKVVKVLELEVCQIMNKLNFNRNRFIHLTANRSASRNGVGRRRIKDTECAA